MKVTRGSDLGLILAEACTRAFFATCASSSGGGVE
eukprot:CAMPEP_0171324620 /NCGR_PEP_ID=MMETSP0816-20121228/116302_1 /TAXON_ID=420281 /ORGANISM="Proboscia inermis, Strain CCAP1064/1" /LENGTH=34 /DNA_ID= /DNA_START= /DNA_END= /DNA_ORIENTATION=